MPIKIATPISALFNNNSNYINDVIELSDVLEKRDISIDVVSGLPQIFHSELSLVGEWSNKTIKQIKQKLGNKNYKFISFHVLSCYRNYKIDKNGLFHPKGNNLTSSDMNTNAKKNIQMLRKILSNNTIFGIENNNYFPTGAYELVTDTNFINRLISKLGIKLLLDIGHAQITASYKNITLNDYLKNLKLSEVHQIHLSSPTIQKNNCFDSHKFLTKNDWEIFEDILPRCKNVKYITIEYYKDIKKLISFLTKLKKILYEYQK